MDACFLLVHRLLRLTQIFLKNSNFKGGEIDGKNLNYQGDKQKGKQKCLYLYYG